jgi:SPP1 gp7 family putative phage head morphogenesis protein
MPLGDYVRSWFAKPPAAPAAAPEPTSDGAQGKAQAGETGWSESLVYAKSSWPKYNPDELMGLKGARVYRKMMTDEQVKAVVRFKRDAITGRRFYFEYDAKDLLAANKAEEGETAEPVGGKEGAAPIVGNEKEKPTKQLRARFDAMPPEEGALPAIAEEDPATGLPVEPEEVSALSEEQELRIRVFEQIIAQMDGSFFDALNGVMTAVPFGFSMTEKVQKDIEVDGKTWVGIKRLALKPFDTFLYKPDEYGNIDGCVQRFEGYEQKIDMERFIHYVQNADVDAHYGQSELREAYRAWFSKDMAIRFWNIFLERYAAGFLKIEPDKDVRITSGTAEHTALVNLLTNMSVKTGVLLPAGVKAELVYPATTDAYEKAIASHDKSIAKALLVPNLLGITEQGGTGSYSQSQTQLEAFMWTLEAEAGRLEEVLNEKLFKPLGELNFGAGPYPRFRFKPLSEAMKMQIIKTWVELVKAKAVTSTDADEDHIRELLDFPEAGEPLENSAPSAAGVAIDPATGKPLPPEQQPPGAGLDKANLPADKKKPIGKGDKRPGETVIGAKRITAKHKAEFLARAVKRVDFAVIDNSGTKITAGTSAKVHEALRAGIDAIKDFIRTEDLFAHPDKISDVAMPARVLTRVRKAAEAGLKDAWDLGGTHARRELEKAQGARFAADEMRLADAAAQKFLESRSYTIAGDLADGARKKVTTILYNGIKGGWALDEILDRIEEELGSTVLPHASTAIRTSVFEAINEARYELFASPEMAGFIEALEFSAILDGRTTEICEHMDERTYAVNDPVWERYTPPLHFNCRSLLVAVTVRDTWEASEPPTLDPMDGFGGA